MPLWIYKEYVFSVTQINTDVPIATDISIPETAFVIVAVDTSSVREFFPFPPIIKIVIELPNGKTLSNAMPLWRTDTVNVNYSDPMMVPKGSKLSIYINSPYQLSGSIFINVFNTFNFVSIPIEVGLNEC